ncbi:ecotropic viral integration site 5 protein homolog isoform X1 [Camellia sinensis]|uniref:ecotropic viral integration site 5 protein homolog isoform X1 n=1 Tax=Camellia sinensis TaxID=4442 RepID=UPI001036D478|nr:ecotropic viral integration site 5 protein homolog isoform X1 [Camellia sinensis]
MTISSSNFFSFFEHRRDAYGFAVRPQHLQRYREYANIYEEEEEERSEKWRSFLDQQSQSVQLCSSEEESNNRLSAEITEQKAEPGPQLSGGGEPAFDIQTESDPKKDVQVATKTKNCEVQTWAEIRPSLHAIELMMSSRGKKRKNMKDEHITTSQNHLPSIEEARTSRQESEENFEEEFYDNEIVDDSVNTPAEGTATNDGVSLEPFFPWKQELEFLVHGGVPRELRGEVWQAFVGVRTCRVEGYYQNLLAAENDSNDMREDDKSCNSNKGPNGERVGVPQKLRRQIEKDLPRTFPGHPALDEDGKNSLRRLLLAYARHNPSVGYCQAMNFFAGLLLLMMPEENAFWTLVGVLDDYFDGYYSEEMIESQVDQLVFEELMRERFPKLVKHLDYLGVQVAWISGPWFLSIFVNMLPWESVLRIWDVLLFEGNRVMIFRAALSLMELYGPALVTTRDAGDAISLLQSLAGSTFDSSQLVLTACMGFLAVTEDRLQELREKYRPDVLEAVEERSKGQVSKDSKGLAAKLYSFKHDRGTTIMETNAKVESGDKLIDGNISHLESRSANMDDFLSGLTINLESNSPLDLQEQVVWLKVELCRLLEEKRSGTLRAEELETALMEMVKQDNRRQLSARVEQLEQEVADLRQALADKKEQENAMLQVLMRVEQEQKLTEDARVFAEQDAAAQRYVVHVLQEKHEKTMALLAQMEKRVIAAESMLEGTLQYGHGQVKAQSSPRMLCRSMHPDSPREVPTRKIGLLSFGLSWRDRNKGKPTNIEEPGLSKLTSEGMSPSIRPSETNSQQDQEN